MFEAIYRLIIGHTHKWVEVRQVKVLSRDGTALEGLIIVQQCEICGKLNNHKVSWN